MLPIFLFLKISSTNKPIESKVDLFFLEGKFMMEGTIRIGGGDVVDAR